MGDHPEQHLEAIGRMEVLSGPSGRRSWPEEVKGRLVAETLADGVSVKEVAERHGLQPQHLSAWRGMAKRGELTLPASATPEFVALEVEAPKPEPPEDEPRWQGAEREQIEISIGRVTITLPFTTSASRIAEIAAALEAAS